MTCTRSSIFLSFLFSFQLTAQTNAVSVSREIKQSYETIKKNLLAAAEKVPQEDYAFKPTPEVRSLSEVLAHVVSAQSRTCAVVSGVEVKAPALVTNKPDLVAALKQSFAVCDKAYDSLTDSNALEAISFPRGPRTRVGVLAGNITHDTEQYAALSVYMRLKSIVPPSSEH